MILRIRKIPVGELVMSQAKYTALIVDSDPTSRMRLKQATLPLPKFGSTSVASTIMEGLKRLGDGLSPVDIVFISHRFPQEESRDFITKGKETPGGEDSAYVSVMTNEGGNASNIATSLMSGFDGFLKEPYSVDDLDNTTILSTKIKKERSGAREKKAIQVIIQDLIAQIDKVAYIRSCQLEPGKAMKKLVQMSGIFHTMSEESRLVFYECAIEAFENAPVNSFAGNMKQYKGASSRIKKALAEKLLAEAET